MTDHAMHRPEAHADAELINGLEPDQLVAVASKPLPRMRLGRTADIALWSVRIFVLALSALVTYTFIFSILHPT